jgi:DHA2 family multidrug resistance protein
VETLNPLNPSFTHGLNLMTQQLQAAGQPSSAAPGQALAMLYTQLGRQASMLSYIDAFHLLMVITFCALPLLLLMQKPPSGETPAGSGH